MRIRFIVLSFIIVLTVGGCAGVPLLDLSGRPVLDEAGEPVVEQKFDADAAVGAATAVAPFVGGPFGLAIPIIASLLPLLRKKG